MLRTCCNGFHETFFCLNLSVRLIKHGTVFFFRNKTTLGGAPNLPSYICVLYLGVSKADRVLHLYPRLGVSSLSMLVMFGQRGLTWGRRRVWARVSSSGMEPERAGCVARSRRGARGAASGYGRTGLPGAILSHLIINMNQTHRIIAMVGTWIFLKIYANLMRF
jgi:hypothetical protein